jgi:hypothetical protein
MFFLPGWLVSIVTFPGVIVHEMAHQLFCRLCRVSVMKVCYFRFGNPAGYVIHERPRNPMHQVLIGVGPFIVNFVNSVVGALIAAPATIPVLKFKTGGITDYILIWLGISIAMHSFPSTGDAKSIWKSLVSKQSPIFLRVIAVPIVGLIYIGAIGSMFWLDLIYGVGIAVLVPHLIVAALS